VELVEAVAGDRQQFASVAVQARREYERLLGTLERTTASAPVTPQA